MVIDLGRRFGLKISPPVAARLADAAGNDQAIVGQELQKLALYIDASPQAPKELDHGAIDAVGADTAEGDFQRLADLALGGEMDELADELARLPAGGIGGIPVVRSLQRRLLMLAPLASAGRARRAGRCRHGVSRAGPCSGRKKPRCSGCSRSGARRIWPRLPSALASSSDR